MHKKNIVYPWFSQTIIPINGFLDSLKTESICLFENHTYTINEEFKSNECRNCTCKNGGHMECIELQCPPCDYEEFIIPGQCCPICKGKHNNS